MARPNTSRYAYTPMQVESMSDRAVTNAYRYLRSIANKRAARISAKGFTDFEYAKKLPAASKITPENMRGALLNVSKRLRDEESFSGGFEQRLQNRIDELRAVGYENINAKNLKQFSQFMESKENLFKRSILDSKIAAQMFNMAAAKGVSAKTIEREFGSYLTSNVGIERLYDAIEAFDLPSNRKRMSSTEIRSRLK